MIYQKKKRKYELKFCELFFFDDMSRRKQARPIKVHEDDITENGIKLLSNAEQNTLMPCKEIVNGAGGANSGSLHQLSENGKSIIFLYIYYFGMYKCFYLYIARVYICKLTVY